MYTSVMPIADAYEPALLCVGLILAPLTVAHEAVQGRLKYIENRPFYSNIEILDWRKFFEFDGKLYDIMNAEVFLFSPRENLTIYVSNLADGWASLYANVVKDCESDAYFFRATLTESAENNVFEMQKWGHGILERQVRALQDDDGWTFISKGAPLSFENIDKYKRRQVINRLNGDMIRNYSQFAGYHIGNVTQFDGKGWHFFRNA